MGNSGRLDFDAKLGVKMNKKAVTNSQNKAIEGPEHTKSPEEQKARLERAKMQAGGGLSSKANPQPSQEQPETD